MNEALITASMTLMLLRASVAKVDSEMRNATVSLSPGSQVLSLEDAVKEIAAIEGRVTLTATVKDGQLFVSVRTATAEDEHQMQFRQASITNALARAGSMPESLVWVNAPALQESILVPAGVIERWLSRVNCEPCSLSLGAPGLGAPVGVVAVLYFGKRQRE